MEKIQAAIAKARASRGGQTDAVEPLIRVTPREEATAEPPLAAEVPPSTAEPVSAPEQETAEPRRPDRLAPLPDTPVTAWLALPAFTPRPRVLRRNRVVAHESGGQALPFDVLRTRMLQQMRTNGWLRVGITSPGAGCGKSVLALNLAFSLSRQPDQRTILFEADLRRPSLGRYLGLRLRGDVSRVFEGTAPLSDHALRHGTNLALAVQTTALRAPAEILQSNAARAALNEIASRYAPSVMLFDLPPMSAGDDVMALAGALDAVLIVAAAEATTIPQVDQTERELAAQTNVMGVVLNKCRYGDEAGYGYGYGA